MQRKNENIYKGHKKNEFVSEKVSEIIRPWGLNEDLPRFCHSIQKIVFWLKGNNN